MILGVTLPSKTSKKMVCATKKKNHLKYLFRESLAVLMFLVHLCVFYLCMWVSMLMCACEGQRWEARVSSSITVLLTF